MTTEPRAVAGSEAPDAHPRADETYLWSRAGTPDPAVQRLEAALEPVRFSPGGLRNAPLRMAWPFRVAAAAAVLTLVAAAALIVQRPRPSWEVVALDGAPTVASAAIKDIGRLARNDWLETDGSSRASLAVANIGSVTVEPGSRVRLVESAEKHHRLQLARGTIEAFITAPPRLFFIDTPSAQAIDMGCIYTLSVKDDDSSELSTRFGLVELVRTVDGREVVSKVPTDATCRTDMKRGPGTPRFDDAPEELVKALDAFDAGDAPGSVQDIASNARPRDTLSLWHLLSRTQGADRATVLERLVALAGRPGDTTDAATLATAPEALEAWWEHLRLTW